MSVRDQPDRLAATRATASTRRSTPSSTTLSSDLPSSIQPCGPKMRFSPEAGLIRDRLGREQLAVEAAAQPSPAWLSDRRERSSRRTARRATARASTRPRRAAGRARNPRCRRGRTWKLAVITALHAPISEGPNSAIQPHPASTTKRGREFAGFEDRRRRRRALRLRLGVGASVFSPNSSAISRAPAAARRRAPSWMMTSM